MQCETLEGHRGFSLVEKRTPPLGTALVQRDEGRYHR
jgi:hypothetical protein